jgi:gliding motility-associated-like protein
MSLITLCLMILFLQPKALFAQVISNSGAVFTATTGIVVGSMDVENTSGEIINDGTLNLTRNLTSAGTISGNGEYYLAGNWTNTGTFNPGTSTVTFNGSSSQNLTKPGGEDFHNLVLTNTGVGPDNRLNLLNDAEVSGVFSFDRGNVVTGLNKLYLSNPLIASLNYTSLTESRVIGKFERGINTNGTYFFPLGVEDFFNPLNLTPVAIETSGSVLSEFIPEDPGNNGLPIPDVFVEVWETYADGYWSLTAKNSFSSSDYDLNVDGEGFSDPIFSYTRVIKRPSDGVWTTDGAHVDAVGTVASRDNLTGNISPGGSLYALAKIRPLVLFHPEDTAICDGTDAYFRVVATGYLPLTYRWQLRDEFSGLWNDISDDLVYSGTLADTVFLTSVPLSFDDNRYRVVIKDTYMNSKDSDSARLTVDPIPLITNSRLADTLCNNTTTNIPLFSDVDGTTFSWIVFPDPNISGGFNDTNPLIAQLLSNDHHSVENIVYRITPTGPGTTFCVGSPVDITVKINPTPTLSGLLNGGAVVCDTATIDIDYTTGNPLIIGDRFYRLETSNTGLVSGIQPEGEYALLTPVNDVLINDTKHLQTINYQAIPYFGNVSSVVERCEGGIDTTISIQLNPTAVFDSILVSDTVICNERFISFEFFNSQITSGTVIYDLATTYSAGDVTGVKANGVNNLDSFTDTLTNTTLNTIQPVNYLFRPIINDPVNGLYCNKGINTEKVVKVAPTLTSGASSFAYIGGRNIRCFGESNGEITLSPIGGYNVQPYAFSYFKNGSPVGTNNVQIEDLNAGTYVFNVQDLIGCSFTDSIELTEPDLLTIADSVKEASCAGFSDGVIYADIDGGTSAYSFAWTGPESYVSSAKDSIVDLRPGIYYLRVRDQNICQAFDTIFLLSRQEVTIGIQAISNYGTFNVSCNGYTDGRLFLNVSGNGSNYADYLFEWTDGIGNIVSNAKDLVDYPAGDYYIYVIDSVGCEAGRNFTLTQPTPMSITRTGQKYPGNFDISCFGLSDGIINLGITGSHSASPGMTYSWTKTGDPGYNASTRNINGLSVGTYNLQARDVFNCLGTASYTLNQPDEIVMNIADSSNYNGYSVSCHSGSNAFVDLSVGGGFGSFSYNWTTVDGVVSNPALLDQSGLPAGNYTLRATDQISCFREWNFQLTEPDTLDIVPVLSDYNGFNVDCFGDGSAWINLNTQGGVGPYNYAWSSLNGSGITAGAGDQSGLTSGEYQVEITDLNNCSGRWTFSLDEPTRLETSNIPKTVSCFGINDGNVDLSVLGGVVPYTYLWSNGETTEDIGSLFIGKYTVDVRDLNNCLVRDSALITEPPKIEIELSPVLRYNGLMISCYGASDADVNAMVTGGFGSYSYSWLPNGETSQNIQNVPAGTYTLAVTDENNCIEVDSFTVVQPQPLVTEVYTTDPKCFEASDGDITVIPQGGNTGFEYSITWSDGQTGQIAENLGAGSYSVVIRDINLCSIDTLAVLSEPSPVSISSSTINAYCPDKPDGSLSIEVEGGTAPYDISWEGGYSGELLQDLYAGKYYLTVTDFNQCIRKDTIVIGSENKECMRIPNAFTPDGDGFNDTWQIEMIELYPEAIIEIYNRWGELIFRSDKGYNTRWDGTFKGRELPIDSYHYVIIPGGSKKPVTGNITLIR